MQTKKYSLIYADPGWSYRDSADDLDADGFCVGCWDEICDEEEEEGNG